MLFHELEDYAKAFLEDITQNLCFNFDLKEFQAKFGLINSSRRIKVNKEFSLEKVFNK